jgi:hypothetical protein
MSRYFLKQVTVEGFRGINNHGSPLVLDFKPDCVNSVHAQNGVGKTSLYEALQYAINGKISRLSQLQDAEQGDSYIVNRFHPGSCASIDLTFSSDDGTPDTRIVVARDGNGSKTVTSPTGHADPDAFLAALREDFVLVDYHAFAGFIDATALNRGRSFASLIGLSAYSNLRQALEGATDTRSLKADLGIPALETLIAGEAAKISDAKRRILEAYQEMTGLEITAVDDRADLEAKATAVLAGIGTLSPIMAGKTVMDFDHDAAVAAVEAEEGSDNRRRLERLREDRQAVAALDFAVEHGGELDALRSAARARDDAVAQIGSTDLLSLLRAASAMIGTDAWPMDDACPVCELEQAEPLKARLDAKVALYASAAELDKGLSQACTDCSAFQLIGKLERAAALAIPPDGHLMPNLLRAIRNGSVPTEDIEALAARLAELVAMRDAKVESLTAEIASLEAALPPSLVAVSRKLSAAKVLRTEFDKHADAVRQHEAAKAKLAALVRWRTFIAKAAKQFSDAEAALSAARLTEIEDSYQDLFPKLMRGAPNLKPVLARAGTTENVDLRLSDFHGLADISARAVLSESYRNAIAASIFLSAATKHGRAPRFMVLDDICSSFDGGHQFNLMEALRTTLRYGANDEGIQFIVLSHDAALEKYFDKLGNTAEWHHQKLQGMPPKGQVMTTAMGADRLKAQALAQLNVGDVDLGGPLVRQYMEYKLGTIISKLQILVPPDYATRPDRRTLSTYIDAIVGAVKLYTAAGSCVLEPAQVAAVNHSAAASLMSNMVSHYETGAGNPLNAYALIGVLGEIDAYADNFTRADPQNANRRIFYKRLDRM